MIAVACFLLWFLGAYAAGVCFGMLTSWKPFRLSVAIVFWPFVVVGLLLYGTYIRALAGYHFMRSEW